MALNIALLAKFIPQHEFDEEPTAKTWTREQVDTKFMLRQTETLYFLFSVDEEDPRNGEYRKVEFWYDGFVVVNGSYYDADERRFTPLDEGGNCLIRVEMSEIEHFYNEHYVAQAEACMEAEEAAYGNWRMGR